MALTWPLPVDAFFDDLPIAKITFSLGRSVDFSETGGGEIIAHKLGSRLWQGKIHLDKDHHHVWAAIEARLALLEEPGASLLLSDTRLPHPIAHPALAAGALSGVKIKSLTANNRELSLKGLPPGTRISRGDVLGFTYGSNPVRYAYHRAVTDGVSDNLGNTPQIEVIPFLRPGATIDTAVTLQSPVLKAKIMAAEYGDSRATVSQGGVLQWQQTLR